MCIRDSAERFAQPPLARVCERRLSEALRAREVPDDALCAAIAVLKVRAVEASIDDCWRLKQEARVGSRVRAGRGRVADEAEPPPARAALRGFASSQVGSFAFFADAGFAHLDFLQACKFAEGDSRILMQKMARDRFRQFAKDARARGAAAAGAPPQARAREREDALCAELARALGAAGADKGAQHAAWDESWRTVYALADAVMDLSLIHI